MGFIIKSCGMSQEADIDVAISTGATHIGLVHCSPSPRHVDLERAAELVQHVDGSAQTVMVLQEPDDALLDEIIHNLKPDILQLHGNESPERCAEVKANTGLRVMKALAISDASSLECTDAYAPHVDMLLLDAKAPEGSSYAGGHGLSFDWHVLDGFTCDVPWLLAGGLTANNVAEAIQITKPYGVDASSSLESSKGVKSQEKIRAFVQNARA